MGRVNELRLGIDPDEINPRNFDKKIQDAFEMLRLDEYEVETGGVLGGNRLDFFKTKLPQKNKKTK